MPLINPQLVVCVAHDVARNIDAAICFCDSHISCFGAQLLPTVPPRVGVVSVAPNLHDLGIQVLVYDHYKSNIFPFTKRIRVSVSPSDNHDVMYLLDVSQSKTL